MDVSYMEQCEIEINYYFYLGTFEYSNFEVGGE